jgi:PAT family acetyl-CoA transporter-like MFS transporter 1
MLGLPVLTLGAYLKFWSVICFSVTVWLVFFKKEDPVASDDPDLDTTKVYKLMWKIINLKRMSSLTLLSSFSLSTDVWILCCVHFIAKIGFIANDSITSLKLVEKGLKKEQLSMIVTVDFVVQLFGGYYAARWAIGDKPLRPWIYAFWGRLVGAITSMIVVYFFPETSPSFAYLVLVALNHIGNNFAGYVILIVLGCSPICPP